MNVKAGKWVIPATFVVGSIVLYGLLSWMPESQESWLVDGRVLRDGYGGEARSYQVMVEGLEEEPVPVTVAVEARAYTTSQAQQVFEQIMDQMAEMILGENPSLMEVSSDLSLPKEIEDSGVRLRWYVSHPEYMDGTGALGQEAEEPVDLTLTVQLTAAVSDSLSGSLTQTYEIPVRIVPPEKTPQQVRLDAFSKKLREQDEGQREQEWVELPSSFENQTLHYQAGTGESPKEILVLGVLMAVLWRLKEQSSVQENRKRREKELLLDYADVLSKLMVLIGAGLTTRNAWERMVQDYEAAKKRDKKKMRAAYEEMSQTCYQMQCGVPEGEAYRDFGRRCRLQPYLKLSSLLEQNRRAGTKNLRAILQTEMADALEQRKNLARRLGEEAGTRLLMPLFLMLGIIMVMIMVPAMMTMG